MLYTAKLVSEDFEEDPDHRGFIRVRFQQQIQWARPALGFASFEVPTKEWIQKYAKEAIDVYVTPLNGEDYLVYTGFSVYRDKLPAEAMKNYAYRRITFSENWTTWYDDKPKNNTYVIKHSDGTTITIDRTPNKETITIEDGKLGNKIVLDKTGTKVNGEYVVVKGFIDLLLQNAALIGLDSINGPVKLSPGFVAAIQSGLAQSNNLITNKIG